MRLLLGSGGFSTAERQQGWKTELDNFLGPVSQVLFVPYALNDHEGYVRAIKDRGFDAGRELVSVHRCPDPKQAVSEAAAIYVGGGNTFRLLYDLYRYDLISIVQERVKAGSLLYVGVSAGTNVAGPTIKTTNDMPIVQPPTFDAFGLVKFQINPHYFSGPIYFQGPDGVIPYAGETRDDRLREFHEMNDVPVLGIREGGILRVEDRTGVIKGTAGATLFRKSQAPLVFEVGDAIPSELF